MNIVEYGPAPKGSPRAPFHVQWWSERLQMWLPASEHGSLREARRAAKDHAAVGAYTRILSDAPL